MNVNDIFRVPAIPTGKNKRKLPVEPDQEWLDRYREQNEQDNFGEGSSNSGSGGSNSNSNSNSNKGGGVAVLKRRNVTVEDEGEEEAGGIFSADDDREYDEEEDEGRFYGGGLTERQKEVLDLLEEADEEMVEIMMNTQNAKKLILKFERAINKNQEMRVKYADDPAKFMESEADLDEAIKSLLQLTEAPHLYSELVKLNFAQSVVGLLVHENTDIVVDMVEVLNELTDEDVGAAEEGEEQDDELMEQIAKGLKDLAEALVAADLLPILTNILGTLNEAEAADYQGIFNTLGIFENLASIDPLLAERAVSDTKLMEWLLKRVRLKTFDGNKQYATEVLSILLQNNRANRLRLGELGGVDVLLQALNQFKRKDPADGDEEEMMENLFDALCSVLQEPEYRLMFLEGEGVELMVIMMKEKLMSRTRSLKVMNYALAGPEGAASCVRFVENLGLKTLFSALMRKGSKKLRKSYKRFSESEEEEHIVGIITSLLKNLPPETLQRFRLLNKFRESEYEKIDRLLEMKESYETKLHQVDLEIEKERTELLENSEEIDEGDEEDFYLRRLEAGLYTLQMICLILLWISDEDPGIKQHVKLLLERKDDALENLRKIMTEYGENIGDRDSAHRPTSPEGGQPSSSNVTEHHINDMGDDDHKQEETKEKAMLEKMRVLGLLERF